ncbi:hypothetical protein EV421DRAFT_192958 [Armillaria borealis]|uniref:Uncharacterized protein n=1 Tax=Armillaria borealis TaxID=47425 RepID=A0AA39MV80_9AGAR|nr:hypothetical protein EV421DRAFT_192958 [Armillaria borealis]
MSPFSHTVTSSFKSWESRYFASPGTTRAHRFHPSLNRRLSIPQGLLSCLSLPNSSSPFPPITLRQLPAPSQVSQHVPGVSSRTSPSRDFDPSQWLGPWKNTRHQALCCYDVVVLSLAGDNVHSHQLGIPQDVPTHPTCSPSLPDLMPVFAPSSYTTDVVGSLEQSKAVCAICHIAMVHQLTSVYTTPGYPCKNSLIPSACPSVFWISVWKGGKVQNALVSCWLVQSLGSAAVTLESDCRVFCLREFRRCCCRW